MFLIRDHSKKNILTTDHGQNTNAILILFQTYQGVKVFVIGSHRSGKSSLIHSLVDQQARLADDVTETAAGIDAYEMSFDYDVKDGKPGTVVVIVICVQDGIVICIKDGQPGTVVAMVFVCLFVGCLTSQQHANVSQGRICTDNFTCCHTEIEAADPTFHLTQSQYTDTGPTSPSADPITPGAWQGSHWSANF